MKRTALKRRTRLQHPRRPATGESFDALSRPEQKRALLRLWAQVVVARDGKCMCGPACHGYGPLVGHHVLRRGSHPRMALNLNNGMALRQGCHFKLHQHVLNYEAWHIERIGLRRWQQLQLADAMSKGTRPDYAAIKLFLEAELAKCTQ